MTKLLHLSNFSPSFLATNLLNSGVTPAAAPLSSFSCETSAILSLLKEGFLVVSRLFWAPLLSVASAKKELVQQAANYE